MGEVSKLIPHPLSLVVNVNFYSCIPSKSSESLVVNPICKNSPKGERGVRYQLWMRYQN